MPSIRQRNSGGEYQWRSTEMRGVTAQIAYDRESMMRPIEGVGEMTDANMREQLVSANAYLNSIQITPRTPKKKEKEATPREMRKLLFLIFMPFHRRGCGIRKRKPCTCELLGKIKEVFDLAQKKKKKFDAEITVLGGQLARPFPGIAIEANNGYDFEIAIRRLPRRREERPFDEGMQSLSLQSRIR